MKQTLLFLSLIVLISCTSELSLHTEQYKGKEILVGKALVKDLKKTPYKQWFEETYNDYSVDKNSINRLKKNINNYQITVVLGTWCGDSQEQTPRLVKVLDKCNYQQKVNLICVPRKYKEFKPTQKYNLQRVPTIIVYSNGKEKGRIIEYPMESIENDLLKIITTNRYRHELEND